MADFPISATARVQAPDIPKPLQRAARQLESAFAAEMLKAARPKPQEGMFGGGIGAHTFDSFMDDALGEAMTRHGELGLASQIARSLARAQGGSGGGGRSGPGEGR